MWLLYLDGGLISSVKMLSVRALPIARSSRARNWAKVSPSRLASMAHAVIFIVGHSHAPHGSNYAGGDFAVLDQLRNIRQRFATDPNHYLVGDHKTISVSSSVEGA